MEAERAELQVYQRHDRTRRSLEYTVYDRELTKIKADIERVRVGGVEREGSGAGGGGGWAGRGGCAGMGWGCFRGD